MFTFFRNCIYTKTQQLNHAAMNFNLAEVTRLLSGIDKATVSLEILEMALGAATTIKMVASRDETLQDERIIPILLLLCTELARVPGFDWDIVTLNVAKNLLYSCDSVNTKLCGKILQMLQAQQVNFNSLYVLPSLRTNYENKRHVSQNGLTQLPQKLSFMSQLLMITYDELHMLNMQSMADIAPGIRTPTHRTLAAHDRQLEANINQQALFKLLTAEFTSLTLSQTEIALLKAMGKELRLWPNIDEGDWAAKGLCIKIKTAENPDAKVILPLFAQLAPTRASLAEVPAWRTASGRVGGGRVNPAYGVH